MRKKNRLTVVILLAAIGMAPPAHATWSIVIVNRETKEVAIGSATCITGFNLKLNLPVVLVDVGAAAAQSSIDGSGRNRMLIWAQLQAETPPDEILSLLEAQDTVHQSRQYGIVDTQGRAATFTGSGCGEYASGLTGVQGPLVYSIQGNVITGQPVLEQAEAALLNTPGDIPEKLLAAMEAARDMGGDGRCSCTPEDPTGCGSPPPEFEKSAHVGFMIATRRGDVDGECNRSRGCANGTYFMVFNVANQAAGAPDPVDQMRERFDAWRAQKIGVPDAVASTVELFPNHMLNDGVSTATLHVEIKDWQGLPAIGIADVAVEHDEDSVGSSSIGPVIDLGDGVYEIELTAGAIAGRDRIAVRVTDTGGVERYLIPSRVLRIQNRRCDLNGDGVLDLEDLRFLLEFYGVSDEGDIDEDGDTDLADLAELLGNLVL